MKKITGRIALFMMLMLFLSPYRSMAAEPRDGEADYLDSWRKELDFSDLDKIAETELFPFEREPIRFSTVVDALLTEGVEKFDYTLVFKWLLDAMVYELEENRKLLLEIVVLVIAFSAIKNFSDAFKQAYISEISFFFIYSILAVLLLQSFQNYGEIAKAALNQSVDFMKVLTPTFCISMVFSASAGTSAGFYQLAFLVIYLIQWLFLKLLLPLVHGYILLVLFNYFFEDERFENLTELLKGLVDWGLKSAVMLVVGMNVVQGLIAPVKDRLMGAGIQNAVHFIPGVGSVMGGIGELLLGSGILIKNCVGVAALVFLIAVGMLPIIKLLCLSVLYKLAAVVVEPVADKRISGCLRSVAAGGVLYLKLVLYCLALFFVTIALTTASTGLHA